MLLLKDRVSESTTYAGAGDYTLGGAYSGDTITFAAAYSNGQTFPYSAVHPGTAWEEGWGTYNSVANTITRTKITASSNAGAAVTFLPGTKRISVGWNASTFFDLLAYTALTDGATITPDMSTFINAKVTIAGNRTLAAMTNCREGQRGSLRIIQDATGGRKLSWDTAYVFGGATGAPVLATAAGASDTFEYLVIDATTPIILVGKELAVFRGAVSLTDGATPALDASLGDTFRLAAAGDRTIAAPSNPQRDGQKIVIQHFASSGARSLALNSGTNGFRFGSDVNALTQTVSGKTDYIGCVWNATDSKWDIVAYAKGY